MTRDEIFRKIREWICDREGYSIEDIQEKTDLRRDLHYDSLDVVEVAILVEDKFKEEKIAIDVTDDDLAKFTTIGAIVDVIAKKLEG